MQLSSEKYSLRALELADEAGQRFDYFMTGLSAAVVSYLAPKLEATALGLNPATLDLLAILLFIVSTFAGLKRIEAAVRLRHAIAQRHQFTELAGEVQDAAGGGGAVTRLKTDEMSSPEQLKRLQAGLVRRAEERIEEAKALENNMKRWYSTRTLAIVSGFLGLLAASIWRGYC